MHISQHGLDLKIKSVLAIEREDCHRMLWPLYHLICVFSISALDGKDRLRIQRFYNTWFGDGPIIGYVFQLVVNF